MNGPRSILRAAGSLWFAALLLILLLVAMACATVFESSHGTERALDAFYRAWWFKTLIVLLCVNVAAAVLLRYPFSKRQIGFVVTHVAILVTLGGALLTQQFGIDGQIAIAEGQTVESFNVSQNTLTIVNRRDNTTAGINLNGSAFRGFRAVDQPSAPELKLGRTRISVERYLPDSVWSRRVIEDDDPLLKPAVEVSLSPSGRENATWIFAGQPADPATASVAYRVFSDAAQLERVVNTDPASSQPASVDVVKVVYNGNTFEIPVEDCTAKAAPLGKTGYAVRVLRYLPHAIVGADSRLTNVSDRRINPAIEVEIIGPSTRETRIAFANFPGFSHGKDELEEVKLTFIAANDPAPIAPLEILGGPGDELYVRFQLEGRPFRVEKLSIDTTIDSPWPGWKFCVSRRFAHARVEWSLEPTESIGANRLPALLLKIGTPTESVETWVQKYEPRPVLAEGTPYQIIYADKRVPLGFALTLSRLRIGMYPGETKPRSYESQITTVDPLTGRSRSHVISMNHPVEHGGYTLYQSSVSREDGRGVSILGVARDPGQPLVFTGYIALLIGMVIVLGTRITEHRRASRRLKTGTAGTNGT